MMHPNISGVTSYFFFFSSRRRHTRCGRDWSSDVALPIYEEWEKNFSPIDVDGICYVRAPFHATKNADYEIVIEPKMSFGTGHHETTYLMMKYLLKLDEIGRAHV